MAVRDSEPYLHFIQNIQIQHKMNEQQEGKLAQQAKQTWEPLTGLEAAVDEGKEPEDQ